MKPDVIHASVKQASEAPNPSGSTQLHDCFELFTQVEEVCFQLIYVNLTNKNQRDNKDGGL
jgi:hypothetical protein